MRSISWARRGAILGDDLDPVDDVGVERRQVLRRNPVFLALRSAGVAHWIALQERALHGKARDVAGARRSDVPVAGDPRGIGFGQHRIEDRLLRQAGRKGPESLRSISSSSSRPTGRYRITV